METVSKKKIKGGFVMQAGILALAGIIVRIIGLLYKSPLNSIIGDLGAGYYSTAYNMYTIILLISSYSIPSAIAKVISQKLALNQYKNADDKAKDLCNKLIDIEETLRKDLRNHL